MRSVCLALVALLLLALGCAATPAPAPPPEPPPPVVPVVPEPPPPPPPPDPRDFTAEAHFEAGSAELSEQSLEELADFAAKLRPFPENTVHVVGYSEARGADAKNPWLAEQRAKSVASFLVAEGIDVDRVTLEGRSADAAGDADEGGRTVRVTVR